MSLGPGAARVGALVIGVGLIGACSGEAETPGEARSASGEPARVEGPGPAHSTNRRPVLEEVRLEPGRPMPGQRVRAIVRAVDPDDDRVRLSYRWTVGGRPVDGDVDGIELRDARRGDDVTVVVVPRDAGGPGEPYTARARVVNRPPRMLGVRIEGVQEVTPVRDLIASPQGHDPDGDHLEFLYEWRVNGSTVDAEGASLSTGGLRRGDQVDVTAVADDGIDHSEPLTSQAVTIGNSPPEIISGPSWEKRDGVFRYQAEARDPDGDRSLRYRLLQAPPGMQVDPLLGAVSWRPGSMDEGAHVVRLEVDDLRGGKAVQTFELTIRVEEAEVGEPQAAGTPSEDGDRSSARDLPASADDWN